MIVLYCLVILFFSMWNAKDYQDKKGIKYILGSMGIGALFIASNIFTVLSSFWGELYSSIQKNC